MTQTNTITYRVEQGWGVRRPWLIYAIGTRGQILCTLGSFKTQAAAERKATELNSGAAQSRHERVRYAAAAIVAKNAAGADADLNWRDSLREEAE